MAIDPSIDILIVDDFPAMLRIMKNLLTKLGLRNVDEAHNGAEALEMLRRKTYGLVLSDWSMEPVSGLELLQAMQREPNASATPFIMVTAENTPEQMTEARRAGVAGYIVKPFTIETLQNTIETALGAR